MSHYTFAEVIRLQETSRDLSLARLLEAPRHDLSQRCSA